MNPQWNGKYAAYHADINVVKCEMQRRSLEIHTHLMQLQKERLKNPVFPGFESLSGGGGGGGGGVLHMMAYTGRLLPKRVSFSGFMYMKG